jgi:hypothetical protein
VSGFCVRGADYPPDLSWRLLDWCRRRGADEFGLTFLGPPYQESGAWAEVDTLLAPFRRTAASAGDRWALTDETLEILRTLLPDGLFTWRPGELNVEDPVIYRGGVPLLEVSSREREGLLTLRPDDLTSLQRSGMPFAGMGRSG